MGALNHASDFRLLTCRHANGTVLPFVYDAAVFPCVQVTPADCQTAASTNAFHFSLHLQAGGLGVCFGVLDIETKQALVNDPDCQLYNGTEHSQSILITMRHPIAACEPCAADHYKTAAGNASCAPCPANARALPGSAALSDCLCAEGCTPSGTGDAGSTSFDTGDAGIATNGTGGGACSHCGLLCRLLFCLCLLCFSYTFPTFLPSI